MTYSWAEPRMCCKHDLTLSQMVCFLQPIPGDLLWIIPLILAGSLCVDYTLTTNRVFIGGGGEVCAVDVCLLFPLCLMWHALPANISICLASFARFYLGCTARRSEIQSKNNSLLRTWLCKWYSQTPSHLLVSDCFQAVVTK